jgi:hypothetical protein
VTAAAGILTIKGERKKAHEVKDADYQYSEVFAGRLGGDTPGKFDQPVQIGSNHRIFRGPSGSRSNRATSLSASCSTSGGIFAD